MLIKKAQTVFPGRASLASRLLEKNSNKGKGVRLTNGRSINKKAQPF
jgi:hypothetical protein